MKKLFLALMVCLAMFPVMPQDFASAGTIRAVSNTCVRPKRLLNAQFAGNMFTTADPSPAGSNLTESSATGVSGDVGTVTVALTNGFTPPITLTAYYWNNDTVTPANSGWIRLGGAAAAYSTTIDTNYASTVFSIPEFTPFLIRSSAAVTGNVYLDKGWDPLNVNSPAGYAQ